jgi:glycogen debranching enzyme
MDSWILAWMAEELGSLAEAASLREEHAQMAARINHLLWDSRSECYFNRRWEEKSGSIFFPQQAPDIFFSLLGKVADPRQQAALKKLFWDPTKFAGEWILPTISRDDPNYPTQHYWKGKAWAPVNWLVYQGMKIYDWDKESHELAQSSAKMFLNPWRKNRHCYENFLSTTGEGSSDPHYTWGAMMVLIAVEELIDANPWHGLRIGNLNPAEPGAVRQYYVSGSLFDVEISSSHLQVQRNGKPLFQADAPIELRQIAFSKNSVSFQLRSTQPVSLRIGTSSAQTFPEGRHQVTHPL